MAFIGPSVKLDSPTVNVPSIPKFSAVPFVSNLRSTLACNSCTLSLNALLKRATAGTISA